MERERRRKIKEIGIIDREKQTEQGREGGREERREERIEGGM